MHHILYTYMYVYTFTPLPYVYVPFWFCPLAMALAVLATWVVADAISLTVATRLRPPVSWLDHTSILDLMSIIRQRDASASALACCTNNWACSVGLYTYAHTLYTHFHPTCVLKKNNTMIDVFYQYSGVHVHQTAVAWGITSMSGTPIYIVLVRKINHGYEQVMNIKSGRYSALILRTELYCIKFLPAVRLYKCIQM